MVNLHRYTVSRPRLLALLIAIHVITVGRALTMTTGQQQARRLFDLWPGWWRVNRNVLSPVPAERLSASGFATFVVSSESANILKFSEKMMLQQVGEATQRYEYRISHDASSLTKHFGDGRLFYKLATGALAAPTAGDSSFSTWKLVAEESHLCVEDVYSPEYTFDHNNCDAFTLLYRVTGPAKSYTIISEFERMKDDEAAELGLKIKDEAIA